MTDATGSPLSVQDGAPSDAAAAALALLENGQAAQARRLLEGRCRDEPADSRCRFLLGVACDRTGDSAAALAAFDRVLAQEPAHVPALNARGSVLAAGGRLPQALASFRAAHAAAPADPQPLVNIGIVLEQLNDGAAALAHYDRAQALDAGHAAALLNRGALLARNGRLQEALANNRQLAERHPRLADAHFNCADVLLALTRYAEALDACRQALALDAAHAAARFAQAVALAALGRFDESADAFARARVLDPGIAHRMAQGADLTEAASGADPDPRVVYLHAGLRRLQACDWSDYAPFVARFARLVDEAAGTPRALAERALVRPITMLPIEPALQLALARDVSAQVERHAGPPLPPVAARRRDDARLRIGYVSADMRAHVSARLMLPVFERHDRGRFEVFCYALNPDDGSRERRRVAAAADHFRELDQLDDRSAAAAIRADGIDILIDLGGYTLGSRSGIFALRPVSLQAAWQGFAGSMGARFIDYQIVDRIAVPHALERCWSEALAFLPGTYFIYDQREPPVAPSSRAEQELPAEGFVFCCFNAAEKIGPRVFEIWMRLLRQVAGSVLWLLGRDPAVVANLRREAATRGIDAGRLVFAPFVPLSQHIARMRCADLFLDTFCFNAHTTACDALRAGLPVLTCPGEAFASRVCASVLAAIGLNELIAASPGQYETCALDYAARPQVLTAIRAKLADDRLTAPLFDARRRVREIEAAYQLMWDRHCTGLPPQQLEVPPQDAPGGGAASQ